MSKSLKNFVSIKDALKEYSSSQIRMLFIMHKWNKTMNYDKNSMLEAVGRDKYFTEFFQRIKAEMRTLNSAEKKRYKFNES